MKTVMVPALGLIAFGLLAAPAWADWEAPPPAGMANAPYGPAPQMTPAMPVPSYGQAPQVVYSPGDPCCEPCCPRRGLLGRIRDRIREKFGRSSCTDCCSPCPAPRMSLLERFRARRAERRACYAPACPCASPSYYPACPTCSP